MTGPARFVGEGCPLVDRLGHNQYAAFLWVWVESIQPNEGGNKLQWCRRGCALNHGIQVNETRDAQEPHDTEKGADLLGMFGAQNASLQFNPEKASDQPKGRDQTMTR